MSKSFAISHCPSQSYKCLTPVQALPIPSSFPSPPSMESSKPIAQDFDYLLVLDFEATCIENDKIQPVQVFFKFYF